MEDIRKAIQAVKGKRFENFAGYFGSVLFNQIKSRIERPRFQPNDDDYFCRSSLDIEAIEEAVMAKYRRCDTVSHL